MQSTINMEFLRRRAPIRRVPDRYAGWIVIRAQDDGHAWAECGPADGRVILFAHGLMGNLFNCADFFAHFSHAGYRMIMPFLPMYDMPLADTTVSSLGRYIGRFIHDLDLHDVVLTANSTGGAASLSWAATKPDSLRALVLIGSSGFSGKPLHQMSIRRNDQHFMYANMQRITVNAASVLPEMIDDVFQATRNPEMAIRIVRLAKSVVTTQMHREATDVRCPTLMCWGDSDIVTPPEDALIMRQHIPQAELHMFASCGHLPQMEQPGLFCQTLGRFLDRLNS